MVWWCGGVVVWWCGGVVVVGIQIIMLLDSFIIFTLFFIQYVATSASSSRPIYINICLSRYCKSVDLFAFFDTYFTIWEVMS